MATVDQTLETLKEDFRELVDSKRADMKKGCDGNECDPEIIALKNRIEFLEYNNYDFMADKTVCSFIKKKAKAAGNKTITYSQFTNSSTYLDTDYAGDTDYQVFLNTSGNRMLTAALDGFVRLVQGGFKIDPAKLQLDPTDELIIIN